MLMTDSPLLEWAPCGEPILLYSPTMFAPGGGDTAVPVLRHHRLPICVARVEVSASDQARGLPPWGVEYTWTVGLHQCVQQEAYLMVRGAGGACGLALHSRLLDQVSRGAALSDVLAACPGGAWFRAQSRDRLVGRRRRAAWVRVATYTSPSLVPTVAYVHASGRVQLRRLDDGAGAVVIAERPDGALSYTYVPDGPHFWRDAGRIASCLLDQVPPL